MNKNKFNTIMYYIVSTICFVASAILFATYDTTKGFVMLGMGIATLGLGTEYLMRLKKDDKVKCNKK